MSQQLMYTHTPIDVQADTHINAPVNAHGWCFGLIPANGNWLDDLIDWQRRQFRQAEVARRMAACWNACYAIPTEELEGHGRRFINLAEERAKLKQAIENAKSTVAQQPGDIEAAKMCDYPRCNCPFDAPSDPDWCARGLPHGARMGE